MSISKKHPTHLESSPWYHCSSRCVRYAWLGGYDKRTNINYDYRKQWVIDRIDVISKAFAFEIAAFSVTNNSHHIVLRIDTERVNQWSTRDIIKQWNKIYKGNKISQKYLEGDALCSDEIRLLEKNITLWKDRLTSISWFMRTLNQPIAKEANKEDKCRGRFFEARSKRKALDNEKAILACMVYVDLPPSLLTDKISMAVQP